MPRIPAISGPEELASEDRAIWNAIEGSRGRVRGPFAMLLHSPELAGRVSHLGAYVRFEGVLDQRTKEVVVLGTARELSCAFEWGAHGGELAQQAGVSPTSLLLFGIVAMRRCRPRIDSWSST